MKNLSIPAQNRHPYIDFNATTLAFRMGGESRPENTKVFYQQVLEWIQEFEQELIKTTHVHKQLVLEVEMHYFNSSSLKSMFEVFEAIVRLQKHNIGVRIQWLYESDDEDMLESGEALEDMLDFTFEYLPQ